MDFNEVKQFIEENKDNEEVKNYIGGFITSDRVESFLNNDDGKKLLQPKLDSYFTKGLETWKGNNLEKLLDEEIKKRFPEKDVKDIELEKLRVELEKIKADATRKELMNRALIIADEKKLPKDLIEFFIGNDEETTIKNLEALEGVFSKHTETLVQERLKVNAYEPPSGGDKDNSITKEDFIKMSYQERVQLANENKELYDELSK
ncbi:DUF4355 domain-containing protein [Tissierella praeacuta]|uniref:DUF4355 domain-containing protein n=1 Tax=Tissierella praeacuta TaxID=43131 RepID=UPI0035122A8B